MCFGTPGKIEAPPNCARIFKRSHCSVTPSALAAQFRKRDLASCSLCAACRMAICAVGFCFNASRRLINVSRSSSVEDSLSCHFLGCSLGFGLRALKSRLKSAI